MSQQDLDDYVLLGNPGKHQGKVVFSSHLRTGWCTFSPGVTKCPEQCWGSAESQCRALIHRCLRGRGRAIFNISITSPFLSTTQQWPHSFNTADVDITSAQNT